MEGGRVKEDREEAESKGKGGGSGFAQRVGNLTPYLGQVGTNLPPAG